MNQVSQVKASVVSGAAAPSTSTAESMPAVGGISWRASLEAVVTSTQAAAILAHFHIEEANTPQS